VISRLIPEALRAARRNLDSIAEISILRDWTWHDELCVWLLHCQLYIPSIKQGLVPPRTNWYILVDSEYPSGKLSFYPAKRNGLTLTFPHQSHNAEGLEKYPWREGCLCLSKHFRKQDRNLPASEPFDIHWKLHWHCKRAIEWLIAADGGYLMPSGDYFELPYFPAERRGSVVFSEGAGSFSEWKDISDNIGLVDLMLLDETSDSFFVKAFRLLSGYYQLIPAWGRAMAESKADATTGIWLRLIDTPVLKPWQAPSTWKELRIVCKEQGIDLDQHLKKTIPKIRNDGKPHILLVGFPIPMKVGESLRQMHWQALQLPILSNGIKTAQGFRPNEAGYWRRDRTEIIRDSVSLHWLRSENWHPDQISTRGRFSEKLSQQKVLLIGVGVVGSMLAEILSRGNVQQITLADADALEIGNLSRHLLGRSALRKNKAVGMAERLNLISPHASVKAVASDFPFIEESHITMFQESDLVLDCTGNDAVLQHLGSCECEREKTFVSISLGMGGQRLFYFTATGKVFPFNAFKDKMRVWLKKEEDEYGNMPFPREGLGCWNSVFPARVDDVWMMTSMAAKHIEFLGEESPKNSNLIVFEQIFSKEGGICGVRRVD
jgi:hypothetical protein